MTVTNSDDQRHNLVKFINDVNEFNSSDETVHLARNCAVGLVYTMCPHNRDTSPQTNSGGGMHISAPS